MEALPWPARSLMYFGTTVLLVTKQGLTRFRKMGSDLVCSLSDQLNCYKGSIRPGFLYLIIGDGFFTALGCRVHAVSVAVSLQIRMKCPCFWCGLSFYSGSLVENNNVFVLEENVCLTKAIWGKGTVVLIEFYFLQGVHISAAFAHAVPMNTYSTEVNDLTGFCSGKFRCL